MIESEQFSERCAIMEHDAGIIPPEKQALLNFEPGFILFSAHKDEVEAAKNYVREKTFTHDEVRIAIRGDEVVVVRK